MKKSWVQSLETQQASDVRANYVGSNIMRKRLVKMLQDKLDEACTTSRSKIGYDNPNWAYLQADVRGYERALQEVINLITDNDKEK